VKSDIYIKYENYDFNDKEIQNQLIAKIEGDRQKSDNVALKKLKEILDVVYLDTLEHPSKVIAKLKVLNKQKTWLQIENTTKQVAIKNEIRHLLHEAYLKKGWTESAKEIEKIIQFEKVLEQTFN
jgi:hypothetical protein